MHQGYVQPVVGKYEAGSGWTATETKARNGVDYGLRMTMLIIGEGHWLDLPKERLPTWESRAMDGGDNELHLKNITSNVKMRNQYSQVN